MIQSTDPSIGTLTAEETAFLKRERRAIQNENKPSALYPSEQPDAGTSEGGNTKPPEDAEPPEIETTVKMKAALDYVIKPIQWLWPGYLAMGKIHILCGRPGCGKTTNEATNGMAQSANQAGLLRRGLSRLS